MSRSRLPVVLAGGDWAAVLGGRLGRRPGDLSHAAVEQTNRRLNLAIVMFMLVFTVLGGRLVHLTMMSDDASAKRGGATRHDTTARPVITDRNGVVLATQIYLTTLGADAAKIDNGDELAQQLKTILPDMSAARAARLLAGKARYVELAKGLTPAQRQAVLQFGNPSLKLTRGAQRVYPTGNVAAHVTGFSSSDLQGLAGLERALDSHDEGQGHVQTSLDIRVQHVVRDELVRTMQKFSAIGAGAVIMDIHNGEVLAMVSLPDFDANRPTAQPQATHFNKVSMGMYELGSVFKVFTAAMALESGLIKPNETFQTSTPLRFGRYEIDDDHGEERPLTIDEIVTYSSNIGSAQLALRVPEDAHFSFLQKLGLTERLAFDLPETGTPIVPKRWTDIERATASYGHGISVSLLHSVAAGAAMVNGGVLYQPTLQKVSLPVGERVIAAETSQRLKQMMRNVVLVGTGRNADVPGYGVMGKTGTANKPVGGSYSETALITSFLGAFPAYAPRYIIHVMIDEPQPLDSTYGYATAGWNAAPTTAAIIRRAAPLLGVFPEADGTLLVEGPPNALAANASDSGLAGEVPNAP